MSKRFVIFTLGFQLGLILLFSILGVAGKAHWSLLAGPVAFVILLSMFKEWRSFFNVFPSTVTEKNYKMFVDENTMYIPKGASVTDINHLPEGLMFLYIHNEKVQKICPLPLTLRVFDGTNSKLPDEYRKHWEMQGRYGDGNDVKVLIKKTRMDNYINKL